MSHCCCSNSIRIQTAAYGTNAARYQFASLGKVTPACVGFHFWGWSGTVRTSRPALDEVCLHVIGNRGLQVQGIAQVLGSAGGGSRRDLGMAEVIMQHGNFRCEGVNVLDYNISG